MIKILVLSDQQSTNHSAIEGIFSNYLKSYTTVVYLPKTCKVISKKGHRIFAPYQYKKKGLFNALNELIDIDKFDIVIVRNLYSVLGQALNEKKSRKFKLGFWKSWPHTYRRFYQSKIENKSKIRKYIEYRIKSYINERKINRCDFFLPITPKFKEIFFHNINIPTHPLGMGYDEDIFSCDRSAQNKLIYFVYIGTIDKLRQTSLMVEAFNKSVGNFVLDLYTRSSNDEVYKIKELIKNDDRISLKDFINREDLPEVLCKYDIGVNFIPDGDIFDTSSPTKIYEYYASGMPSLMNNNPDFFGFLDKNSAFISNFDLTSIMQSISNITPLSSKDIIKIGALGRSNLSSRSYKQMSNILLDFLMDIANIE
jgi:hypothetical protein